MSARNDTPSYPFGRIAVAKKFVTPAQLQECLDLQARLAASGKKFKIGDVMLARKYLAPDQIQKILAIQAGLATASLQRQFPAGEVIFWEDDPADRDLYLLRRGAVDISKNDVLLETCAAPGTFFGIPGFVLKAPHATTATAKTDCEVLRLSETSAAAFFKAHPGMLAKLSTLLAQSLRRLRQAATAPGAKVALPLPEEAPAPAAPLTPAPAASPAPKPAPAPAPAAKTEKAAAPAATATPVKPVPPSAPAPALAPTSAPAPKPTPPAAKPAPAATATPAAQATPVATATPPAKPAPAPAVALGDPETLTPAEIAAQTLEDIIALPVTDDSLPAGGIAMPAVPTGAPAAAAAPAPFTQSAPELCAELAALAPLPFSQEVQQAVKARVDLLLQIEKLEDRRQALESGETPPSDRLKAELGRQRHEFLRIPPRDSLETAMQKLQERLDAPLTQETPPAPAPKPEPAPKAEPTPEEILAQADAEEAAAAAEPLDPDSPEGKLARAKQLLGDLGNLEFLDLSDFTDDDTLGEAEEEAFEEPEPEPEPAPGAPVAPVPEEDMRAAYAIAVEQKKILIARYDATPAAIAACAKCCENEPLYQAMERQGLDPAPIFGWGALMLAMREYGERQGAKLKAIRKEMADLANAKGGGGFFGFGGKKGDAEQRLEALQAEEKTRLQAITNINRDAQASEAEMVAAFWDAYRQLALKYVAGMDGKDAVFARAFLRWGALGMSSRWLLPEQMRAIVNDCFPVPTAPDYSLKATSLYYADEVIIYTARGQLPPSPNEDLELNHRNSPEWKVDRAWRRMVNCMGYNVALKELLKEQLGQAGVLRRQAEEIEELLGKKRRPARGNAKEALDQLKDKAQRLRVAAHRYEANAERLEKTLIPRNDDAIESSRASLKELGITVTPESLAEHEIRCLRRYSRLVAKLKEPFLPFALRDRFKPEIKCVNSKPMALEMLADAERRDPGIFLEPLVPGARREHQLYVRRTPMIILAPAGGILGFVAGPRSGNESGRFVIPSYVERAAMREEILWRTLSDFRYDTSKAAAGVDLMTSDTLVAAYATLRWNLRKRDRELRQKAGIYTEENERTNFRRHYAIYMKSALDSGKLLFFRCPELYELIIPKYIQLPQGCEILRR